MVSLRGADEGTATVFLVDVSRSLSDRAFERLRETLSLWIREMGPPDRAALVVFGDKVQILKDFSGDRNALLDDLGRLRPDAKHTQLNQGILTGLDLARRRDPGLPRRRVLVVLSDGEDDMPGGATSQEVREGIARDPVPIYAVGYVASPRTPAKERNLKTLGEYARSSGGALFSQEGKPLEILLGEVRSSLERSLRVDFDAPDVVGDGSVRRLQVTCSDEGVRLSGGVNVRVLCPFLLPSRPSRCPHGGKFPPGDGLCAAAVCCRSS
jgi:hypothetical protein